MDSATVGTQRLVHLDLKGAPPRISYFEKVLPFIKSIGATGILVEWEDTFPYSNEVIQVGSLSNYTKGDALPYTLEEAHRILAIAAASDLTVIPLVQTFGHMEFVLKHEQWRGLREVEAYPSSICPSKSDSMLLITSLLKQVIEFHPNREYIHIGGDEVKYELVLTSMILCVWHMGICSSCQDRVKTNKFGKAGLYLDHISAVAKYIKKNYPNLRIIVWDDMFRNIELGILHEYSIGSLFEPMVWNYNSSESFHFNEDLWVKYITIFPNIWGASAFRGATSSCQLIPVTKYHISNHEAWLADIEKHREKMGNFRGIALTGWSRFDHYATLCELLPCSIPSLCLCMNTWLSGGYSQDLQDSVRKLLGYNDLPLSQPTFPGWQIFVGMECLANLRIRYKNLINSDTLQTWFNIWQVKNNYTNPMQVEPIHHSVAELLKEIIPLKEYLKEHFDQVFFDHTVEELLGTLLLPVEQHLNQLNADIKTQLSLGS